MFLTWNSWLQDYKLHNTNLSQVMRNSKPLSCFKQNKSEDCEEKNTKNASYIYLNPSFIRNESTTFHISHGFGCHFHTVFILVVNQMI